MNPTDRKMIRIRLNGQDHEVAQDSTLIEILAGLGLEPLKVAVERNLTIVPRAELGATRVAEGDEIEVVRFVGGGAPAKAKAKAKEKAPGGSLVIVESPAKCKTIEKYLGPGFELAASMGHVIDLPRSEMGIDVEHGFEPRYIVVKDRKKTLADLKKRAKDKANIYLACDPDREGEAISWHLEKELGKGKNVARVVFNEITKEAVREAFKHPGKIDMNLVGAQQARRVLDRLVGYSLSPLLWQKVGRGLSAGRVQSVALRIIVDREREIRAFKPEEYWSGEADLKKRTGDPTVFTAKLERIDEEKTELKDGETARGIVASCRDGEYKVADLKRQEKRRHATAPFTTSKLQQAAYNQLRFPASKTMRVAQTLYEGVELGMEGSVGLITYMRTDSVRISDQAVREVREHILKEYGAAYLPEKPNTYKSKKQAQEAHEAIRPTGVTRRPEDIQGYLTPDQYKLYRLIWSQTVASQMTDAVISQEAVEVRCGRHTYKATGSRVIFAGFFAAAGRDEEKDNPLPPLSQGEALELVELRPEQHFTKPPARYTDASLVKALEERGIGRPSTYAPIIQTLTARDYIRRDGGALVPTELGFTVTDLLVGHFEKVLDFEFTANMEGELDRIDEGELTWVEVVKEFYEVFKGQVDLAKDQMTSVKRESQPTDEICTVCGKPMVIKWGRRGRFLSCSGWPECRAARSISTEVVCPTCGQGKLVERRARSGRGRAFFGCTRYPECTHISNKLPQAQGGVAPGETPPDDPAADARADG